MSRHFLRCDSFVCRIWKISLGSTAARSSHVAGGKFIFNFQLRDGHVRLRTTSGTAGTEFVYWERAIETCCRSVADIAGRGHQPRPETKPWVAAFKRGYWLNSRHALAAVKRLIAEHHDFELCGSIAGESCRIWIQRPGHRRRRLSHRGWPLRLLRWSHLCHPISLKSKGNQ